MVAGRSLHSGINTMYTEAFDFFCVGGGFVTHGSVGEFLWTIILIGKQSTDF